MNVENIMIDGKKYIPVKEYNYKSCLGCSFYHGGCKVNKLCKSIGNGLILVEIGRAKPSLTDYRTIKSYEDACIALGEKPKYDNSPTVRIDAYIKLETISRAIRECEKNNCDGVEIVTFRYFPNFDLYTKDDMEYVSDMTKQSAIHVITNNDKYMYFALSSIEKTNPHSGLNPLQILSCSTEEKAFYFGGRNFIHLWADYFGLDYVDGYYYIDNINE